jgi:hypothetical protein
LDGSRFDRLVQVVGGSSRRLALRTAFGGVALAAGLLAPAAGGDARKKRKCKKKCRGRAQGETCTTNKDCCANETRLACSQSNSAGTAAVCCGANDGPCNDDGDCCLGLECSPAGQCQVEI